MANLPCSLDKILDCRAAHGPGRPWVTGWWWWPPQQVGQVATRRGGGGPSGHRASKVLVSKRWLSCPATRAAGL